MKEPKYKIGDRFFLVVLRNIFKEDRVCQYEPFIREYMINGVKYEKHEYCDDRCGRPATPRYSEETITYQLSTSDWINAVESITEESLGELYGKTPEQAKENALALLLKADLLPNSK